MYAPVVLFVYNRKDHTKQVLDALQRNSLVKNTDLYIFSDAAKNEFEIEKVKEVRQYLKDFEKNNSFKTATIIEARENKGLEKSIITGITQVMNQYGRVIILEDDILTSEDFLLFMNQALEYYEKDNKIWSISGYTIDSKKIKKYKKDVFVGERASCWGWASWKDRWDKIDWEVKDYDIFRKNKKMRKAFNKGGADMSNLLDLQQRGEVNSWAIRWCYQQFKEGMVTVFPKLSKVNNIGVDGSGTNCGNHKISAQILGKETNWNFEYDLNDRSCFNEFRRMYSGSFLRQRLGYYWYKSLYRKSCVCYRNKYEDNYTYIKLNGNTSSKNPRLFSWKGKDYIFFTEENQFFKKNTISVLDINNNNSNITILKFSQRILSFTLFSCFGEVYMVIITDTTGIKVYKMGECPWKWLEERTILEEYRLLNIEIINVQENKVTFTGNVTYEKVKLKRILFEIQNWGDFKNIKCNIIDDNPIVFQEKRYIYYDNGEVYCIKNDINSAGKYVIKTKINKWDEDGIEENLIEKIDKNKVSIELYPFIYRVQGIFNYLESNRLEVAEINLEVFSLLALLSKVINGE